MLNKIVKMKHNFMKSFNLIYIILLIISYPKAGITYSPEDTHAGMTKIISSSSTLRQYLSKYLLIKMNGTVELEKYLLPYYLGNGIYDDGIPENHRLDRILKWLNEENKNDGKKAGEYYPKLVGDHLENSIANWLQFGSMSEDKPIIRAENHFHNPLKRWDSAGLDQRGNKLMRYAEVFSGPIELFAGGKFDAYGLSALLWAEYYAYASDARSFDNYYSWQKAREYYAKALKADTKEKREHFLALTFYSLGSSLHIIEDMTQPDHVRNDFFPAHVSLHNRKGNPYEKRVAEKYGYKIGLSAADINQDFRKFSDFIDTTPDGGTCPPSPVTSDFFGIAEYTNCNFFSEGTITIDSEQSTEFESPLITSALPIITVEAGLVGKRYLFKATTNEVAPKTFYLAAASASFFRLQQNYGWNIPADDLRKVVTRNDENVMDDYAKILLPKAMGYGADLLAFFFDKDIFAEMEYNHIIRFRNRTGLDMEGTFFLYYNKIDGTRLPVTDLIDQPYEYRTQTPIPPGPDWVVLQKPFKYPNDITSEREVFVLIFQGKIGDDGNPELQDSNSTFYNAVAVDYLDRCGFSTQDLDNNIIYVPEEYANIQEAINNVMDDQKICIAPGTYPFDENNCWLEIPYEKSSFAIVISGSGIDSTILELNSSPNTDAGIIYGTQKAILQNLTLKSNLTIINTASFTEATAGFGEVKGCKIEGFSDAMRATPLVHHNIFVNNYYSSVNRVDFVYNNTFIHTHISDPIACQYSEGEPTICGVAVGGSGYSALRPDVKNNIFINNDYVTWWPDDIGGVEKNDFFWNTYFCRHCDTSPPIWLGNNIEADPNLDSFYFPGNGALFNYGAILLGFELPYIGNAPDIGAREKQ